MANKDLKNRHPFSNSIDNELWNKLKSLAYETKVPLSKLLDEAVKLLLNKYERSE